MQCDQQLSSFGLWVLLLLERDEDWSADTLAYVAEEAERMGLGHCSHAGLFEVAKWCVK